MAVWLLLSILLTQGIPQSDRGTITGVVRLPDGTPASGVRVAAMVLPGAALRQGNASELAAIGITDESGRYRIENVPAGRYYVVAGRVDAPTYYPGVRGIGGATAISVTSGAILANMDFVSARVPDRGPPLMAPGRVVIDANSSGKTIPAWVTLNRGSTGGEPPLLASRSSIAPDGTFSISLPSGELLVSVRELPEGYLVKSMTSGSTDLLTEPLEIKPGMAEIVIVVTPDLRPRFSVGGRVTGAANRNLMGEHIDIELSGDSGLIARIIPDAQGQFIFRKLLPGDYRMRMNSLGPNAPEQRITVTDRDVTAIEFPAPDLQPRQ